MGKKIAKIKKTKKIYIVLGLLIFLVALGLRTYRVGQRYQFGLDEEYQATLAMTIVKDFHPIWIGVNASDTGFYLGPYWTYLTALLLKIGSGDVLVTAYAAALLGSITALTVYLVVKKKVNPLAGVISGGLYAVLPMLVFFDQKYWNPSLIPLITILFVYLASDVKDELKFVLLAVLMAVVFHVHLSLLALLIPLGYVVIKNFKAIKKSSMVKAVISFFVVSAPLIVFDYYKKGSNLKAIIGLSSYEGTGNPDGQLSNVVKAISRLFYMRPGLQTSEEVLSKCATLVKSNSGVVIGSMALLVVIAWAVKAFKESEFNQVVIVSLGSFLGLTLMFKGVFREYYLLGAFVLIIVALASFVSKFSSKLGKALVGLVLVTLIGFSLNTIVLAQEDFGLSAKKELIEEVSLAIEDGSYRVVEDGSCHKYAGWRYLFKQYADFQPTSSSIDANLGWLYEDEILREEPDFVVTVLATKEIVDKREEGEVDRGEEVRITSGGFTALVEPRE